MNTKITEIENKIPHITGLVTATASNIKSQRLKIKYQIFLILPPKKFNRLTKASFYARMKEAEKSLAS